MDIYKLGQQVTAAKNSVVRLKQGNKMFMHTLYEKLKKVGKTWKDIDTYPLGQLVTATKSVMKLKQGNKCIWMFGYIVSKG